MIDESCKGEGATHNACSCVLDRMAKLEAVSRAAEWLSSRLHTDGGILPAEIDDVDNALAALKDHVGDTTEKVCDAKEKQLIKALSIAWKALEWHSEEPIRSTIAKDAMRRIKEVGK